MFRTMISAMALAIAAAPVATSPVAASPASVAAVEQQAEDESQNARPAGTVVEVAAGNPDFSTLVTAVKAAGLVETLSGAGPFTVFAPTNEAFAALPPGTLDDLLQPENKEKLAAILTYHVIAGDYMSGDLAGQTMSVTTVNGADVAIDATDGVNVGGATVIAADVAADNGVIHAIDKVLLPPSN